MTDIFRGARAALIVGAVGLATVLPACGSGDNPTASSEADAPIEAASTSGAYCDRAADYLKATQSVDTTDVPSILEGFARSADAARAVADVAPAPVLKAHQRLADAAEHLVSGLRSQAPQTVEDLRALDEQLDEDLTAEYGDLDQDAQAAQRFATEECGLSFD